MANYEGIKTQNGCAYPDLDLQDEGLRTISGGGGNQGLNNLGQPYATAAIGSGPRVETGPDDKGVRKGASFCNNFERTRNMTDRKTDNEVRYDSRR